MGTEQGFERVVTPEAVALDLDVAGVGSRGIAMLIDLVIQTVVFLGILLVTAAARPSETLMVVLLAAGVPLIFWGYFFLFEGLWRGQTPGKRAMRLRVTRSDGQPMSGAQMFVRNLLRIVDFLPMYYMIGIVAMAVTSRSQRLGDLAAGTLVIREVKAYETAPTASMPPPPVPVAEERSPVDVTLMTEAQYQLARAFLERRHTLDRQARPQLASEVATVLRPVLRPAEPLPDERLIEAAAAAYRGRFG